MGGGGGGGGGGLGVAVMDLQVDKYSVKWNCYLCIDQSD